MSSLQRNEAVKDQSASIKDEFIAFTVDEDHPCIMAKTATKFDRIQVEAYDEFGSKQTAKQLVADISSYVESNDSDSNRFESFVAVFPNLSPSTKSMDEKQFECLLWRQLSLLHHVDSNAWDDNVSKDPADPNFSFSVCGKAFYVVGLHPNASRAARRFKYPALVFNFHHQFEKLREMGSYHKVRDTIRTRDKTQHGSINPMLRDFGQESEARQYSGRAVDKDWECPFKHDLGKST